MESKDTKTEVPVLGTEAPSNYQTAPKSETLDQTHSQALISPTGFMNPVNNGVFGLKVKKKMGRPRKYGIDGSVSKSYSPMPISASGPPFKRGRGRGYAASKQESRFEMASMGDGFGHSDGANFTPHVIIVNVGEDVTAKIISLCQQGPRAICILSANGMVSNATLRQCNSSGGTLTYEGCFEIVTLCGSFTPTEREGTIYRAGGMAISLSSPNGQVIGGCVGGLLTAASPIQIIVGSFLPTNPPELKPKKHKVQPPNPPTSFTIAPSNPPPVDKEACNGQGQNRNNSVVCMQNITSPSSYQQENWPNTHHMQERQTPTTDTNISLPGGMQ